MWWKWIIIHSWTYSWLPTTRTLANSNLALTRTKVDFPWMSFTVILPSVTRTLDNSSLPLSRSNFCFPSAHFCTISPWIYSNHRYKRVTSRVKNRVLKSETLNLFQNNRVNSLSLLFCHSSSNSVSTSVYFVAQLPFLPIHLLISLLPVICFKLPITRTFFDLPWRFRLSEPTVFIKFPF